MTTPNKRAFSSGDETHAARDFTSNTVNPSPSAAPAQMPEAAIRALPVDAAGAAAFDAQAGELIDFDRAALVQRTWLRATGNVLVMLLVGTTVAAAMVGTIMWVKFAFPGVFRIFGKSSAPMISVLFTMVVAVAIVNAFASRARRRLARRIAETDFTVPRDGLRTVFATALGGWRMNRRLHASTALTLSKMLAARGLKNATVRVASPDRLVPLHPIAQPFEARTLDESNPDLFELRAVAVDEPGDKAFRRDGRRRAASPLKRNFILNGGWFLVLVFGMQVILSGLESLRRHELTFNFMLFSALLVASVFLPLHALRRMRSQWFVANGGVVLRFWRNRAWQLHIFDRRNCVLVVRQLGNTARWWVSMADQTRHENSLMTEAEAQVLLAAWLSPLSPPPADHLSDLTA